MSSTVLCFALVLLFRVSSSEDKKPNIIMIVADDLGWNDVSFHGSPEIPTPNLDAMASNGMVLDQYYVQPLCTPSRSALMTGYYPIHTGTQTLVIIGRAPLGIDLNFKMMPEYLKNLGYVTRGIGKWHLGSHKMEYLPTSRGFDSFYGNWQAEAGYYDHTYLEAPYWGLDLHDDLEPVTNETGHYATDLFTSKAVDAIRSHDTSKPLFMYLAHRAVHFGNNYAPLEAPEKYIARFPHIPDYNRRLMAALVSTLDDSIGDIFEALQEAGMLNNTIVALTTDNGAQSQGYCAQSGCGPDLESASSNYPLRGSKFDLWEGGVRGVGLLWSSSVTNKKPEESARRQLMHITDWLPTLYHAAGGKVKDLGSIDGVDMWESLVLDKPSPRREVLLNIDPVFNMRGIINGTMKLIAGDLDSGISYFTNRWMGVSGRNDLTSHLWPKLPQLANKSKTAKAIRESGRQFHLLTRGFYETFNVSCGSVPLADVENIMLFDISTDPCEYRNIAKENEKIVKELDAKLDKYAETALPPYQFNPDEKCDPDNYGFLWTNWGDENPIVRNITNYFDL